ncbi:POLA2 [Symbiodinium sp. CCMP2456]|nr:POLA2 [Symbiodinium sp. CCMP2456]
MEGEASLSGSEDRHDEHGKTQGARPYQGPGLSSCTEEPACLEEVYVHLFAELRKGLEPLRAARPATQVFIIPSLEEAVNFHPLPQPPMDIMLAQWLEEATDLLQLQQMGVRFLSNPAHVEINGIKVSITSADALSPILREMVLRPEGRKVEEALQLLLKQRCLFPAVPRDPAQVYEAKAKALDFPWDGIAPQICIFPSPLAVMNGAVVENTLFVNPGTLCRQAALGSFAELWIQPAEGVSTMKDRVRLDLKKLG